MFRIVIFGHARFAEGLLSAVQAITGQQHCLVALCADRCVETEKVFGELEAVLGNETVVLCDLAGGSPWRIALDVMRQHKGAVLAGANLPMILDLVASCIRGESLEHALGSARQAGIEGIR